MPFRHAAKDFVHLGLIKIQSTMQIAISIFCNQSFNLNLSLNPNSSSPKSKTKIRCVMPGLELVNCFSQNNFMKFSNSGFAGVKYDIQKYGRDISSALSDKLELYKN